MPLILDLSVTFDRWSRGLRRNSHKGSWRRTANGDWVYVVYDVRVGRVAKRDGDWIATLEAPFGDGLVPEICSTEAEGKMMIERWRRLAMESDGRVAALLAAQCLR